jgi:hypothetical protein
VDADDPLLCDAAERVARETGYDIWTHRLDFFGLCPACREKGLRPTLRKRLTPQTSRTYSMIRDRESPWGSAGKNRPVF